MGRGFQRGRGLERGRGRHQAKYTRKKNIYNKYGGFQRARGRGISERDRGKNQAKYVGGKSDTSLMHKGITQHNRPLNCYTDLDMPVDEQENTLEDIRIGNPRLTHEVELERRTEEQQHERSVYNGQRTELKGKRVNKQNQTNERRTDYQRDAFSSELQAVNDFHGDLRHYIRQKKCMEFPDNEDRPMGSGHDTDDRKHEDVISYKRDRSIDGREEDRPIGCFDIKSNDLSFDQDCLAREGNDRHVDQRCFLIYRHEEVSDDEGIRYFEKSGKRGSSHGSNYDFRGGNNGQKCSTERAFKRARHEHIRVDERGHENLLHVRVDDEDMFLLRRSPLNPVKDYSLNGHPGRNDAVKHERYISKCDAEKYEARRHIKEDSQRERREDSRSFDNRYLSSRLSGYVQVRDPHVDVRDPHVEHVTHMLTANEEGRGCDNLRFDDRNHLPDAYFNSSDAVPRYHMKNSVNGFGEGNSSSRDLYTEIRDQLSVEELQRGQTGDPFNERVFLSNVQRKIHDEELKIHTELRDFYADTELEGNRSTQSCLIDETSSGNHCPAELLQTQGGSHASRKRKIDFDSKIVKKTNRKRKSRSEIRKGIRTNENDRRSPAGNDDQRFITEEYMEKANRKILVSLGTEIVKAALNHPSPCASFDYLCNNTYQGREFETKYCLKTFVQKMFKDTGIKVIDDGIEIPKVNIKICQTYTKTIRHDHVCKDLHICKFFMIGRCNNGNGCPFLHDLRHVRNNLVLKRKNIDKLPDSIVLELCRHIDNRNWTTLPIVCKFYNNEGACKHGDRCQHLHICKFYIEKNCKFGEACKRNHKFQSLQTRNVLENFGIENIQEEEIKIIMQMAVNNRRAYEVKHGSNSPIEIVL